MNMHPEEKTDVKNTNDSCFLVMLVDDQTIIAEAVKRILQPHADFELHYCSKGKEALQTALRLQPTVILQDLLMPDANGMDLLKAYHTHPTLKDTPVVILSVKEDPEIKKEAFEAGAYDYMVKLPDPTEFVARVRHHAQGFLADRQLAEAMRALRESQRQTHQRNLDLEKINEQKNRILGVAAHDLRNPIGLISQFSDFIAEEAAGMLNPEQVEMVTYIQELSEFALKMVEDLLDVSTIESGKLRLNTKEMNLTALIRRNVELNTIFAHKKNIRIEFETDSPSLLITADEGKITQVLNNLISNAVKYSPPDSVCRVRLTCEGSQAVVTVTDQGPGISEIDLPKLFKPFGRANVQATGGEQSTGLGLAISHKIVEGHGGKIGVTSQVGQGSTFYFRLPLIATGSGGI